MNYDPIHNLERLSALEPSPSFVRRTRRAIVQPRARWFALPRVAVGTLAFATLAILAIVAPISFSNPGVAPALSADAINREFDNLSIAITLGKLQYDYPSNRTITNAVLEITDTKTPHLNGDVLKSEQDAAASIGASEDQIDVLLEQVTR